MRHQTLRENLLTPLFRVKHGSELGQVLDSLDGWVHSIAKAFSQKHENMPMTAQRVSAGEQWLSLSLSQWRVSELLVLSGTNQLSLCLLFQLLNVLWSYTWKKILNPTTSQWKIPLKIKTFKLFLRALPPFCTTHWCFSLGDWRESSITGAEVSSRSHQQMVASSHDITSQCKPFSV